MDEQPTVLKSDSEQDTAHINGIDRTLISGRNGGKLAPCPPGVSGNPKGRPPDAERFLTRLLRQHPDAWDVAARTVRKILEDPENRHFAAVWREALDRTEGPVASQTHHHVSTDRAIVTHAQAGPAPELPGLPEPDKALPSADISTDESSAQ